MVQKVLTVENVSAVLGLSRRSIQDRRFRERIGLRGVKIGKSLRFLQVDVLKVIKPEDSQGLSRK